VSRGREGGAGPALPEIRRLPRLRHQEGAVPPFRRLILRGYGQARHQESVFSPLRSGRVARL